MVIQGKLMKQLYRPQRKNIPPNKIKVLPKNKNSILVLLHDVVHTYVAMRNFK